jgi:glycosyltransferase involved in cell wall biosynthesis
MPKLSVALLTYNEERNIIDCLESVKWANEIVLVDERSCDKTVVLAKKYVTKTILVDHDESEKVGHDDKVDIRGHDTMFHLHKQKAIDACTGDWIFQIDADERVSPEMKEEILEIINSKENEYSGYQFPRKNFIFGRWIGHAGWYPDYQVKLFRRGKGYLPCRSIHELISIDGKLGTGKSSLMHFHYNSVYDFVDRLNKYTTNDANYLYSKGERVVWQDSLKFPLGEFYKRYFQWEGYKDGIHGLTLSMLQALSRLVVFSKLWEKQHFFEREVTFGEFEKLVFDLREDYLYWIFTSKISNTKTALKRLIYKSRRYLRKYF